MFFEKGGYNYYEQAFKTSALLTMCIFVFGFALTGCGVATTTSVKISSATKASCTVSIGFDDEMIESMASLSNTTKQAIIKDAKKSGLKYSKRE